MPAPKPQGHITIAKREGQPGVIPISAVTDRSKGANNSAATRQTNQRLKVVVRRLPPGLTEQEFFTALGEEWKTGSGKVSWANFRPGKVSKDLAKYSKPARCFLQLLDATNAQTLAQKVPKTTFADAKGTQNDSVLIGPPHVEYAVYGRVPNTKRRNDARQGTIDQDPEFMDFLQSLTAPIQKPKALDASDSLKQDTVRVTPLIQHLRDKKAAKEKLRNAKQEKQQEDKKAENQRPTSSEQAANARDSKAVTAAKASAKSVGKDVRSPARNDQRAGASPRAQPARPATTSANNVAPDRRHAGAVSPSTAAARMLSRDLPFQSTRGGRAASRGRAGRSPEVRKATLNNAAANGNVVPPAQNSSPAANTPASPQNQAVKPASTTTQSANSSNEAPPAVSPPTGPKTTDAPSVAPLRPAINNVPKDPSAKRAFLKHANASQGINDYNLLTAMRRFGFVTNVTIDSRKGFAYVDFAEPDHLRAAMAASPVPVAQGNVEVLELKNATRPAVPPPPSYGLTNGTPRGGVNHQSRGGMAPGFRGGRGAGPRGGRGGRNAVPRGPVMNGSISAKPATAAQPVPSTTADVPVSTAPTAPSSAANANVDVT